MPPSLRGMGCQHLVHAARGPSTLARVEAVGHPAFWRAFWSPQREPSVLRVPATPTQLGTAQERVGAEAE